MRKNLIETNGCNAVIEAKYGYVVYNRHDLFIGKSIEQYGEFCELEIELFRQICKSGDRVIDVGANIGTHALALSRLVGSNGRVYAFEPQRIVFQMLCANMALNNIENVECYQSVVSYKAGSAFIQDIRYDLENNYGGFQVTNSDSGVKVPVIRLDDFLDISGVKLIKIDVEGMEFDVISGAVETILRHKPVLYVENDKPEKSEQLIELIKSLGYRMYWHYPPLFNPANYAENNENIFKNLYSINMICLHSTLAGGIHGYKEITDPGFHPLS